VDLNADLERYLGRCVSARRSFEDRVKHHARLMEKLSTTEMTGEPLIEVSAVIFNLILLLCVRALNHATMVLKLNSGSPTPLPHLSQLLDRLQTIRALYFYTKAPWLPPCSFSSSN
jgi:hypothetical protein